MQTDFTEKQLSKIHFKANLLLSTIFAAVFSVTGTIISRHFSVSNTIIGFILAFIFIFVVFLIFDPKTIIDIRVKPEVVEKIADTVFNKGFCLWEGFQFEMLIK